MNNFNTYHSNNPNKPNVVVKRGINFPVLFLGLSPLIHPIFVLVFIGYYLVKGLYKEAMMLFFAYISIVVMLGISMLSMFGGLGALMHTGNMAAVTTLGAIGVIGMLGIVVMFTTIVIVTTRRTNEWIENKLTDSGYELTNN